MSRPSAKLSAIRSFGPGWVLLGLVVFGFLAPTILGRAEHVPGIRNATGEIYVDRAMQGASGYEATLGARPGFTVLDGGTGVPKDVFNSVPVDEDGRKRILLPLLVLHLESGSWIFQGSESVEVALSAAKRQEVEDSVPLTVTLISICAIGLAFSLRNSLGVMIDIVPFVGLLLAASVVGQVCTACSNVSTALENPGAYGMGVFAATGVIQFFCKGALSYRLLHGVAGTTVLSGQVWLQWVEPRLCTVCACVTVVCLGQLVLVLFTKRRSDIQVIGVAPIIGVGTLIFSGLIGFSRLEDEHPQRTRVKVDQITEITKAELVSASGIPLTDVVVITLPGCGACDVLKSFLVFEGIPFSEIVDRPGSGISRLEFSSLGYPVILGFEPSGRLGYWNTGISSDPDERIELSRRLKELAAQDRRMNYDR